MPIARLRHRRVLAGCPNPTGNVFRRAAVYADLFDEDLDGVADRLDATIKICCGPTATGSTR